MQLRQFAVWMAVLALAAGEVRADEAVTLRYQLKPGDKTIFQTTTTAVQSQSFNNMDFKTTIKSSDVGVRTCAEVDKDGNFRIQSENKLLKVVNDIAVLGKYTYDSQAAENDKGSAIGGALTPIYDRMKGAVLTVVVSPRGEVVKLEGFQELVADVIKDNPLAQQFAGGGSDDAVKLGVQEQFIVCPEKPVKPGDTWEATFELPLPKLGTVKGKRTYKYEGPDKVGEIPTAKIGITTEFSFDLKIDMDVSKITGTIGTTASEGTAQFDVEKGRLLSLKTKVDFAGDMQVEAGGQSFNISMKQTQETDSRLLDAVPEKIE